MLPDVEIAVAPARATLDTVSLSVTVTVKVTISVLSLVFNSIELFVALLDNDEIVGGWLSTLLILTVIVSVTLFPAVSVTVAVNVSLLSPKLKSL